VYLPGQNRLVIRRPAWLIGVLTLLLAIGCSDKDTKPQLSQADTDGSAPLVKVSRDQRPRAWLDDGQPHDHIHAAFGVYICDHFLKPVTDRHADELGIHTHGEGIIHIHPFSNDAAGPNARLRVFFADTDIRVRGGDLQVPGTRARSGTTRCDGKPAQLELAYWADGEHAAAHQPDKVITRSIWDAPLNRDLAAYTLAFVPKGTKVPPPPAAKTVRELGTADK